VLIKINEKLIEVLTKSIEVIEKEPREKARMNKGNTNPLKSLYRSKQKILNKANITNADRLEMVHLHKLIKIKRIKELNIKSENQMIEGILENSESTKILIKN